MHPVRLTCCLLLAIGVSSVQAHDRWQRPVRRGDSALRAPYPEVNRRFPGPLLAPYGWVDPYRFDGFGYDPYRYGSFRVYNHLDDAYLREQYRYHTFFPGRRRAR